MDLQPIVKGDDLEYTIDNLIKLIKDLHGTVAATINIISSVGKTLVAGPAAALSIAEMKNVVVQLLVQTKNLSLQEKNLAAVKNSYKNPMYEGYFKSQYCRAN